MSRTITCPLCQTAVSGDPATGAPPPLCPSCQAPLAPTTNGGSGPAWWLGGTEPSAVSTQPPGGTTPLAAAPTAPAPARDPRQRPEGSSAAATRLAPRLPVLPEPDDEPQRLRGTDAFLWSSLGLVVGVIAFALCWVPKFGLVGMILGGIALLLGLVGGYALRHGGSAMPLTSAVVGVQAALLGAYFTFAATKEQPPQPPPQQTQQPQPPPQPPQEQPPPQDLFVLAAVCGQTALTDACFVVRHPDRSRQAQELLDIVTNDKETPERRINALAALGDTARRLGEAVPDFTALLFQDANPQVRSAACGVLGHIGPQARGAYPALLHVSKNDGDANVRLSASQALDRIGRPTTADLPTLLLGLNDPRADYRAAVAQTLTWVVTPDSRSAVKPLRSALGDPDPRVKLFAAQALWLVTRQTDDVLKVFRDALNDRTDASIRSAGAHALAMVGNAAKPAAPDLRKALTDADLSVRLYAAIALWGLEHQVEPVLPVFRDALKAKDLSHRHAAVEAVARIADRLSDKEARTVVPLLIEILKSDDLDLRAQAAFALGQIGPEAADATPLLIEMARAGDQALRENAIHALGNIGPRARAAVPVLIETLEDKNPVLRGRAAVALTAMGNSARAAGDAIKKALSRTEDGGLRVFLAQALWRTTDNIRETVPILIDVAADGMEDTETRALAVSVLREMGAPARISVPALALLREEADPDLRGAIDRAVEHLGKPAKEDVPVLMDALKSNAPLPYRRAVAQALWWVAADRDDKDNAPAVAREMPALLELCKDKDPALRLIFIQTFEALGPAAKDAVPLLVKALDEKDETMRLEALAALTSIGPEARPAIPRLIEMLEAHELPRQRTAAATCLAGIGPAVKEAPEGKAALEILEKRLNDPDPNVRIQVCQALFLIDKESRKTHPVLKELLTHKEPHVRADAAGIIGLLGRRANDKETVEALTRLLKDPDDRVRRAATEALKSVDPK
jgi:HEAT repeat protein